MKNGKIFVFVLGLVMFAAMGISGCGRSGVEDSSELVSGGSSDVAGEVPEEDNGSIIAEAGGSYNMPKLMTFTSTMLSAAEATEGVSLTLTATVKPDDAPDKSVDWSVSWLVPIEGEEVTDYVTVTPKADGSNVATVTAYKGFENASILITVTTRVGGFTAECKVLYEGIPERLDFVFGGEAYKSTSEVELSAGETYEIGLKPTNALGDVGSKYNDFEITQIQMKGRFNATRDYVVNGSVQKSDTIVIDLSSPTFAVYDSYGELSGDTRTILPSEFMDVTLSGNTLTVVCKKPESAYLSDSGRTGTRVSYAGVYEDPRNGGLPDDCYLEVYVREKTSGESCLIQLDMVSSVTGVELPESTITI